jgi:drug/metabolite transporter (DMT)-like permease
VAGWALAAHAGGDQHTQMIVAAVVGAAAVFACYWVRRRRPAIPRRAPTAA